MNRHDRRSSDVTIAQVKPDGRILDQDTAKHPRRVRATYRRTQGVRHMLAALDLTTGKITYRIRQRKRWPQFLDLLKVLRRRWPRSRLYLILDNYGPHKRPEVLMTFYKGSTLADKFR